MTSDSPTDAEDAGAADGLDQLDAEMLAVALSHHGEGRFDEAEQAYQAILSANPDHPDALHLLGVLHHQTGRNDRALELIGLAIDRKPDDPDYYSNLGAIHQTSGNLSNAAACFEEALKLNPDHPQALNGLGITLTVQARAPEAEPYLVHAAELVPDNPDVQLNLGNALLQMGRYEDALAALDAALAVRPDFGHAHNNRANALKNLGRLDEAETAVRKAIGASPERAGPRVNLALIQLRAGRIDDAIATLNDALLKEPSSLEALLNMGVAQRDKGDLDGAIKYFDRVLEIFDRHGDAQWNRSLALLLKGDFERGLPAYEWRWNRPDYAALRPKFPVPIWRGEEDVAGKRMFLHSEQGLGDTLQFVRYTKVLADRGATVVVGCQAPLARLLRRSPGIESVVAVGDEVPGVDMAQSLVSTAMSVKTTLETIPADVPYLFADADAQAAWAEKLAGVDGLKVGIAWRGNPQHPHDYRRSATAADFAPLAALDGVSAVNLQIDATEEERAAVPGLVDLTGDISDMDDTAALVANLDAVVAVDTAVVHLAGGMAKPAYALLSFVPDWRWMLKRDDTPWYPTVRLLRQPKPGDWASVVADAAAALGERTG